MDDSVPRCFFTGLPGRTKDLKLTVHTESSQMDINGKVNTFGQKRKKKKQEFNTQHIYTCRYTAQSLYFSSTCFMAACNPLTPVKWLKWTVSFTIDNLSQVFKTLNFVFNVHYNFILKLSNKLSVLRKISSKLLHFSKAIALLKDCTTDRLGI